MRILPLVSVNDAPPGAVPARVAAPSAAARQRTASPAHFKTIELGQKRNFTLTALEIGLSSNCNFRCDYCCAYNFNDRKFMSAERVVAILEDAPDLQRVKLSGGEVLIYFDECVAVVEYCARRGLLTQINTNGTLLDEVKLQRLQDAGLGCLHVSYNYTRPEDFCAYYKQTPKVFDRIERTIRTAAASDIDTVVESVIFRGTDGRLPEINHRLFELGVRKHEIQNGIPIRQRDWADVLPPARVQEVIADLIEARHPEVALYFSCIDIDPQSGFHARVLRYLTLGGVYFPSCIEGRNQLHVHSNGDVLICELGHPVVIGNLNGGTMLNQLLTDQPPALVEFLERRSTSACSCTIRTLEQPV